MLAGRWILFPGTHACRHSLWQPPYARLAKTLDSFASPARSMKPLAMTCALAVACLHSKAQFEPHIAEGNLVAYWKAGAIHSRAITSITQVRGNLRRPSQWSSKRWPWDGSVERGSQSNRRTKAVQGAMNRAPLECDSHTSDVPRQHLAASRLAGETKGFAKRTAPVAGKAARRTAPRRGRSTNGYGTWRRNEKRARRPFLNDLQTSLELYRSIFGAGNESCTRALSLCFPNTFSTVVISEELNYSLVFRPRQQSSSNHFHQRPRMIHPPVVTPDASSC
ncbi:hypothetical protein PALA22_04194 [Pseudomonas aeruginosa]|nr:hypothetical protein PALA22_04194 [Pseudomonas aeruginosa]